MLTCRSGVPGRRPRRRSAVMGLPAVCLGVLTGPEARTTNPPAPPPPAPARRPGIGTAAPQWSPNGTPHNEPGGAHHPAVPLAGSRDNRSGAWGPRAAREQPAAPAGPASQQGHARSTSTYLARSDPPAASIHRRLQYGAHHETLVNSRMRSGSGRFRAPEVGKIDPSPSSTCRTTGGDGSYQGLTISCFLFEGA